MIKWTSELIQARGRGDIGFLQGYLGWIFERCTGAIAERGKEGRGCANCKRVKCRGMEGSPSGFTAVDS